MRFDLTDDERALQAGVRDLCRGDDTPEHPKAAASPGGVSRDSWTALGEAGVFSLRRSEDEGGLGLGMAQAVVVFEELGRANVPGPTVATHLAAGSISGAAEGAAVIGIVDPSSGPLIVEHLEALDALVVMDAGGLRSVPSGDLAGTAVREPLDPLTPLHLLSSLPEGEALADVETADRWRLEGAALTAAQQVGLAGAATDAAVEYAKRREQFGRPIGSFQAVKHLCADMLVRTEIARVAVHAAGVRLDDADPGAARAVAGAKLLADEAAFRNGKDCIQIHGGMGFTWEQKVHLFVKRAAVLRTHFGAADRHLRTLSGTG